MQKNFRIIAKNEFDFATLSTDVDTELSETLPLTNMQIYNNSRVARFETVDQSIIYGTFSVDTIVNCVVLWRHTLTQEATWRVRLFSGVDQTGTVLYDNGDGTVSPPKALDELDWGIDPLETGINSGFGTKYAHLWTGDMVVRSFEITLKDESGSYFDVARIYMGRYFTTEVNIAYGLNNARIDNSEQIRTKGAGLWSIPVSQYRRLSFDLLNLTPAERNFVFEIFSYVGKNKDFYISVYPELGGVTERDFSFAGKFTDSPETVHDIYNNYSTKFLIEEV